MGKRDVTVEFYVDQAGEYRWRAKAANGRIVATSAEGYGRMRYARRGLMAAAVQLAKAAAGILATRRGER